MLFMLCLSLSCFDMQMPYLEQLEPANEGIVLILDEDEEEIPCQCSRSLVKEDQESLKS